MSTESFSLEPGSRTEVSGAPEGAEGIVLERLAKQAGGGPCLLVLRDDARMARVADVLQFFLPKARRISIPAWDCLPYDRVPPHRDIAAQRVAGLCELAQADAAEQIVVLTTVSSALQRIPPRVVLASSMLTVRVGQHIGFDALIAFLSSNGYTRAGTVREPGEYAVRGGIVDMFPPGQEDPIRLDLFGDEVEGIRQFDALSQLTKGRLDALRLYPVSEVQLDDRRVARFRSGYRASFGAVREGDQLYEAVSSGQRHPALEHWLPLFHDRLETLFDMVPAGPVVLDYQVDEAISARLEMIGEYYGARQSLAAAARGKKSDEDSVIYNPLPRNALYLDDAEWQGQLGRRAVFQLWPFQGPDGGENTLALGGRQTANFGEARNRPDINLFDAVRQRFETERKEGRKTVLATYSIGSRERLIGLLRDHGVSNVATVDEWSVVKALPRNTTSAVVLNLDHGFSTPKFVVYTEEDILGDRLTRRTRKARKAENFIAEASALNPLDLVVHAQHGIGRYDGLETIDVAGAPHDCVRLVYAGDDKLFLPVENLEVLTRFGSEDAGVPLDRLGGAGWQARKAKVKQRITDMADQLLKVAAERELKQASKLEVETGIYDEFVAQFPFVETEDQERAIIETLEDLSSGRPTDRLICGDVGFGKTEVALRAAFVTVMAGFQVAVVVPTTLLARQHFQTFRTRFTGLPVRVAQLSRLVGGKEAKEIRNEIAAGTLDIVIGTHALLGKSIKFLNLGLLVVDEEQRFGVGQKERLKQLRSDVHVLTLTATPIPRTLQLALSGVRELSLIASPPVDRLAVRTFVLPYDPVIVREAIMREHFRGGQVFYVCPRIQDLATIEERLKTLVPEIKYGIAHGQLNATDLEAVMSDFYEGKFEVLLCTNIVESGLDIPTANTMIIHRSDMFGLAQLYQLRGRVGRSKTRAYAYLTVPADRTIPTTAKNRLEVMQTLDTLGAGFSLASHDLDIRGAGNLLGEEQSGRIREVGVELYQQMLEEAVAAARDEGGVNERQDRAEWSPNIAVGTPVLIPEVYVQDLNVRLGLYRRIANLEDRADIDGFAAEMIDRFGSLPDEVVNLLEVIALKRLCRFAGVEKLEAGPRGAVVTFHNNEFADPSALVHFLTTQAGKVQLRPDHKLVYRRDWVDEKRRLQGVRRFMEQLANMASETRAAAAE